MTLYTGELQKSLEPMEGGSENVPVYSISFSASRIYEIKMGVGVETI